MASVREIYEAMDRLAPFSSQMPWDNSGLQIGTLDAEVKSVLLALDCTTDVVEEAVQKEAQLVLTHHPLLFDPLKCIPQDSIPAKAIRGHVNVISSHTCLDVTDPGVNDALASRLGLDNVTELLPPEGNAEHGLGRIGMLDVLQALSPEEFADLVKKQLGVSMVRLVPGSRPVAKVAVCGGAGGDLVEAAVEAGCDALVTGEVKHHEYLLAYERGITLVDAGHFATETVVLPYVREYLASRFPEVSFEIADSNAEVTLAR